MAYDHVIADSQFTFAVINLKAVQYYIAAREIWYAKWHLVVMHPSICTCNCTVFHFIGKHITLISPEIIVALCFCPLVTKLYFYQNSVYILRHFVLTRGHLYGISCWYTSIGTGLLVCSSVLKMVGAQTY